MKYVIIVNVERQLREFPGSIRKRNDEKRREVVREESEEVLRNFLLDEVS